MPDDQTTLHVVAIHGVGAPEPGARLADIKNGLIKWEVDRFPGRQDRPDPKRGDTPIGGRDVHYLQTELDLGKGNRRVRIYDANWSDIGLAPKTPWRLLPFLLQLLVIAVRVGGCGWKDGKAGKWLFCGAAFRLLFSCVLIWLSFPVLLSLAAALLNDDVFIVATLFLAGAAGLLAWVLLKVDPFAFGSGLVVFFIILALGFAHHLHGWPLNPMAIFGPAWVKISLAIAPPLFVFLALVEGAARGVPWAALASRIGMLVLGFGILSALAAGVMFFAIAIWLSKVKLGELTARSPDASTDAQAAPVSADQAVLTEWGRDYACALPYQVGPVEIAATIATFAAGAIVAWVLFRWYRRTERETPDSGAEMRTGLRRALWAMIAIFAVFSIFLVRDVAYWTGPSFDSLAWTATSAECDVDLFAIYSFSFLRVMLLLFPLAIGPVRIGLDVAADILFYLQDGTKVRHRLRQIIEELRKEGEVVVVGHSQGSRIAADVLFGKGGLTESPDDETTRLVTTGSPISSLYGGFLDRADIPALPPAGKTAESTWTNFWRGTDFVGGVIGKEDGTWPLNHRVTANLKRNHIDYWIEPEVMSALLVGKAPS